MKTKIILVVTGSGDGTVKVFDPCGTHAKDGFEKNLTNFNSHAVGKDL